MKLASVYNKLHFTGDIKNATASCNSRCRLVVNRASCQLQIAAFADTRCSSWFRIAWCDLWEAVHRRVFTTINTHDSVTIQNRTHADINFFDHKYTYLEIISCSNIHKSWITLYKMCNLVHFLSVVKLWTSLSSTQYSHGLYLKHVLDFERPRHYQVVPQRTFSGAR